MSRCRIPLCASVLLAALIAAGPGAGAREIAVDLSAGIGIEEIREHVRILAGDGMQGRRAGDAGGDMAAEYIAARFAESGLVPGGDEGTFLSWFDVGRAADPESCGLRLSPAGEAAVAYPVGADWRPFGFSPAGSVKAAEVVFAGYGIRAPDKGYDDYEGIDVEGKVVVIMRRGPGGGKQGTMFGGASRGYLSFETKSRVADAAGAAAVILVDDRLNHPEEKDTCANPGRLARHRPKAPFLFAKRAFTERLFAAAGEDLEALEAEIERTKKPMSRPLSGATITLSTGFRAKRSANVVGILQGGDPKLASEALVIGAHYDHLGTDGAGALDPGATDRIWNGADDNASGTAGLIEMAENLALADSRPPRTLVFVAFTGEELGLLGSGHYVRNPAVPLKETVAMVNMDMIGRLAKGGVVVGGTKTGKGFEEIVTAASEGAGINVRRTPHGFSPSDNLTFTMKKIPTLFFFTGVHRDYHRTTDDWDLLNYEGEQSVLKMVTKAVRAIAGLERRPEYVEVPRASRSGAYLGILPSTEGSGPGLLVESVMQASPAAKAGMIDGDRIVTLGDQPVGNLGELRAALRGKKPGDRVEVKVRRGEETVELTVKLGGR